MAGAQGETPRRDKGRAGAAHREGSQPDEASEVLRVSAPDICPTVQLSSLCSPQLLSSISEQ